MIQRILFALKHKTLSKIVVNPADPKTVLVYDKGATKKSQRFCPHQGAPMEKGYVEDGKLVCGWHGCKFDLK